MIQIIAIGRLTKDVTTRSTQTGKKVAGFTLATSDGKDQNGKENTIFLECTAWESLAKLLETYGTKGTQLFVQGSAQENKYTNKEGYEVRKLTLVVQKLKLLGGKNSVKESDIETTKNNEDDPDDYKAPYSNAPEVSEDILDGMEIQMPF